MTFDRDQYVADLIEEYLNNHPDAMDSFEGIRNWWVTQQKLSESVHSVSCALRILIDRGVVEKTRNEYYKCTAK